MIAVCRLRYCQRIRTYLARRTAQGKTKTEIIRCLKRYIARETYHALLADLRPTPQPPPSTRPDRLHHLRRRTDRPDHQDRLTSIGTSQAGPIRDKPRGQHPNHGSICTWHSPCELP
jgi:hypothetical protein